jgi:hypothetical protein
MAAAPGPLKVVRAEMVRTGLKPNPAQPCGWTGLHSADHVEVYNDHLNEMFRTGFCIRSYPNSQTSVLIQKPRTPMDQSQLSSNLFAGCRLCTRYLGGYAEAVYIVQSFEL